MQPLSPEQPSDDPEALDAQPMAPESPAKAHQGSSWVYSLLLLLILAAGAFLRFRGIDWDEYQYVHPDERFLGFVENDIQPVESFGEYFDTANSTLNPMNRGHGFFVYGTLPIFLLRYVLEWTDNSGYANFASIGRPLSGLFDLATVLVLYLIASKLFNRRVGLLAAAFSAFAVLQIQLSHFFTVDTFANFFIWFALYLAVLIAQSANQQITQSPNHPITQSLLSLPRHPAFVPSLLFGLFSGMALASKISAYPLVLMLPFAAGIYLFRQPEPTRIQRGVEMVVMMGFAGVLCLLAFRIFQPYAFTGPGFFDVTPNPQWMEALRKLQDLLRPSIGYPPAVQWVDRPVWFSWYNITAWGLGWPLGLAAWVGMLWMGWRIYRKREFQPYLVIWVWTTGHFIWQSLAFNPTMRYQLPIYPGLALLAAWGLGEWMRVTGDKVKANVKGEEQSPQRSTFNLQPIILAGSLVVIAAFVYALAFSGIYVRGVTRLNASRWMFEHISGPLNLQVQTANGAVQQPLSFPQAFSIRPGQPYGTSFAVRNTGTLTEISLGRVVQEASPAELTTLLLQVLSKPEDTIPLALAVLTSDFAVSPDGDQSVAFTLADQPVLLQEQEYFLKLEILNGLHPLEVCGPLTLFMNTSSGQFAAPLSSPNPCHVEQGAPLLLPFIAQATGNLTEVVLGQALHPVAAPQPVTLRLTFANQATPDTAGYTASLTVTPDMNSLLYGGETAPSFVFDPPITLEAGALYSLQLELEAGVGQVRLEGSTVAVESSWDDPLPYRVDNYDPYGGIYQSRNFEMYWFDDEGKRQRFYDTLDDADIVTISSSRQWGSVGRLAQVYPISTAYYRYLLGCPEDRDLQWCYIVAEPGMFQEQLGFKLIQTFDSNPQLGPLEFNTQHAEEAFTVYDHPKVFIFAKTADYDPARVRELLGPLPLGRQLEEVQGGGRNQPQEVKSLLLTPERLSDQQNGGTWAELFHADGLLNTVQPLTVLVWYGAVSLLGLLAYPIIRLALPGLDDRGYPLARTAGLLILSYMVWLAGSLEIPVIRATITIGVLILAIVGLLLGFVQLQALRREVTEKWRYFLTVEGLTLAFFLILLFIRIANPDLWHPWKGGEKPMDFAYLNAVIRSTTFPPYDPWFSGGYINYYYYGFVFVGMLVKWLGIVPAVAYNLILPTLFSMLAMGAFSIGWNLVVGYRLSVERLTVDQVSVDQASVDEGPTRPLTHSPIHPFTQYFPYLIGLAAAIGITLLGNLGTPRMIIRGYERLGMPPEVSYPEQFDNTFFLTKWGWAAKGFLRVVDGESLPYPLADWYWNPSRIIPPPEEPITEFPFFTFLYADLHAHMMALPITVLALAWVVSVVLARGFVKDAATDNDEPSPPWFVRLQALLQTPLSFLLAGIVIGALRPTNTWDFPTYLALAVIGMAYGLWQGYKSKGLWSILPDMVGRVMQIGLGAGVLVGLSLALYRPFSDWYALGYTETKIWQGSHTPLNAYLSHWGVFLFLIVSWMVWETLDWMANTPVSALRKVKPYLGVILILFLMLLVGIAYLMVEIDAPISWLVMLLAVWAGVLLLRPGMPDAKRLILFLTGTGLVLTQTVEVIVLSGDIGRMNTVFKFYLQVWVLFGVSAAASLAWLASEARDALQAYLEKAAGPVQRTWQFILAVLVFGAAMYPVMAGMAKVKDRMADTAPVSLNGQEYLNYARYNYNGVDISLTEDYRAMRWLQENVQGTPPIVEAQLIEYTWTSRFAINTGLPAVLGWNWHQRQQRTGNDADVWQRHYEIAEFYETPLQQIAVDFLNRYSVRYIIVGQLERAHYSPEGLAKFDLWNGEFWHEVYRDGQTVIYEVGGG